MAAKKSTARKSKRVARKATKKSAAKRPAARGTKRAPASSGTRPAASSRTGLITHTELASADPAATQKWCEKVLGWKFVPPVPTPTGPYRMWRFPNDTGGGIRSNNPPELPGSIPYVEVASIRAAYSKALAAGAKAMLAPMELPGGMGFVAVLAAPGGVAFGFWAGK